LPDGSMLVSDSGRPHSPRPGIIRVERDGAASLWFDSPLDFANGMALSPNGSTLFVAESWAYRIRAIEVLDDGRMAGRDRIFADLGSVIPDGLCVDADGSLYVGCYEPSQVLRITAAGAVKVLAHDPTAHVLCHPTGVAVRGNDIVVANLGRWHLSRIPRPAESGS
jgi:sugar lactone lactonase YvrE